MKRKLRICLDTNVWIDAKEKKTGSEKSKILLEKLTSFKSPHKIIIPFVLKLELLYKKMESTKKEFLIKNGKYTPYDLEGIKGKELIFNTKLPSKYQQEIDKFFKELETSQMIEITKPSINFSQLERLVKEGFEIVDSLIILQANESSVDYFVTRDKIARKINTLNFKWLNLKAVSPKGMINILKPRKNERF